MSKAIVEALDFNYSRAATYPLLIARSQAPSVSQHSKQWFAQHNVLIYAGIPVDLPVTVTPLTHVTSLASSLHTNGQLLKVTHPIL